VAKIAEGGSAQELVARVEEYVRWLKGAAHAHA
jgi:hypothetical protein